MLSQIAPVMSNAIVDVLKWKTQKNRPINE